MSYAGFGGGEEKGLEGFDGVARDGDGEVLAGAVSQDDALAGHTQVLHILEVDDVALAHTGISAGVVAQLARQSVLHGAEVEAHGVARAVEQNELGIVTLGLEADDARGVQPEELVAGGEVDDAIVGHSGGPVCQSLLPAHLWVETRGAGSFCYND